jgi:hypothetical protein
VAAVAVKAAAAVVAVVKDRQGGQWRLRQGHLMAVAAFDGI